MQTGHLSVGVSCNGNVGGSLSPYMEISHPQSGRDFEWKCGHFFCLYLSICVNFGIFKRLIFNNICKYCWICKMYNKYRVNSTIMFIIAVCLQHKYIIQRL